MTMMELGFPVGATALKITSNGRDYPILLDTDTFDRTGEDGDIPILPLCRGDEFIGESLAGAWKKGWTTTIDADQAFTAIIDSGLLKFKGEADLAGTYGYGWIKSMHVVPMMNETEVTVELEVPINDVVAGNNRAIYFKFFLCQNKVVTERPSLNDNTLFVEIHVTDNGLLMTVAKSIEDADTNLFTGSTYIDGSGVSETADKFTVWRIVFHDAVAGATAPEDVNHMHVYLKQGVDRPTAEGATENELSNSPYDISDILFDVGYPAYQISTQNVDYYDDGTEAVSTYFRVNYPSLFSLKYDFADADVGKSDVELWDGDPDVSTSVQVFDEDHVFTHDAYLQNGLIRLHIDEAIEYGLKLYSYYNVAWNQPFDQLWFNAVTGDEDLRWPVLRYIESISPEKTVIWIRLLNSDTINDDYYLNVRITIERGKYSLKLDNLDVYPDQDLRFWFLDTATVRFGYVQDNDIGDDDINEDGDNSTPTDNFLVAFDDDGEEVLGVVFTDEKPAGGNTRFFAEDGGDLSIEDIDTVDTAGTIIWISLIPFSLLANLFIEAEDATLGGGAARYFTDPTGGSTFVRAQSSAGADNTQTLTIIGSVGGVRTTDTIALNGVAWVNGAVDFTRVYILELDGVTAGNITVQGSDAGAVHIIPAATTHVDNAVILDAINEFCFYPFQAGTHLPEGRYLAVYRVRDTAPAEPNDLQHYVQNATDGTRRNEENDTPLITVTGVYAYYSLVFDITAEDVSGNDFLDVVARKITGNANEIYVDYFLIIPIGDGANLPQDLSHSAMRSFNKPRRLYVR